MSRRSSRKHPNEAAELLGVSVECIRELVRAGALRVCGTYAVYGGRGAKGWLVSEPDVLALRNSPEVELRRRAYARWKEARRRKREELPLPKAKVRPLLERRRVRPDGFQREALQHAIEGCDVLLVAPTGAGKTWVA
ncbi:MAG: helix-turn-helix domain-containing protein, partial [Clostridia bacterium]|nr:helix-turn-helix domain-containing protein [Clostridia bacterium]